MASKKIMATVITTIAASLCCITPVLAVLVGAGSLASSFSWLEPYRNYLIAITILVLLYAWYDKLKPVKEGIDCACDEKSGFFASKLFLFMISIFSIIMLSFPLWGYQFFNIEADCNSCETEIIKKKLPEIELKKYVKTPKLASLACETGSTCAAPYEKKTRKKVDANSLPVLKYMDDEYKNPTPCNQVPCSGTGYVELDALMSQARTDVEEMSPTVLKKMIDNDEELVLIDVREVIQRSEGEIYASESYAIPRTNLEFEILNKIKDKNIVIVLYSRQGARSLFAAQSIQKLGYKNVYNLSAGLKGWARANYPFDNGLGVVVKVEDE
ncbi:MAG: rhodanese-related sulfurtransferase [Sulfurimonas sp.]|jgi:rhodanese-related sulfurtransferase|uniref:mercuric transporter MerT family protein n=1 Tax=Sulfurimonas sp. TaxID=2022749 RepID=UPI0039E562A4